MRGLRGGLRRLWPFLALETATALAGIANGIATVAFPWLVLERTGNPSAAAAIGAITLVPLLATSLISGTIVDLVGRRAVSVASDLLSFLSVAAIPLLDGWIGLGVGWLAALAVLGATFDPAGITARESMLPDAARASGLALERANGIHEATWGVAFLVGPGVAGLLIALVGAVATFWGTAACFGSVCDPARRRADSRLGAARRRGARAGSGTRRSRAWPSSGATGCFAASRSSRRS